MTQFFPEIELLRQLLNAEEAARAGGDLSEIAQAKAAVNWQVARIDRLGPGDLFTMPEFDPAQYTDQAYGEPHDYHSGNATLRTHHRREMEALWRSRRG